MANPDDLTLFARVRANIDGLCRQTGDRQDMDRLLMLAERGSIGEGDDAGPGWFVNTLAINQVRLPLRDAGDGDIEDADGNPVVQIDPNCERPDEKVTAIAVAVVLAINTCGGFHSRVEHQPACSFCDQLSSTTVADESDDMPACPGCAAVWTSDTGLTAKDPIIRESTKTGSSIHGQ